MTLSQRQWIPRSGVFEPTSIETAAFIGTRDGAQRSPVDLSLTALGWTDNFYIGQYGFNPFDGKSPRNRPHGYYADNTLTIGAGSRIDGEPGASVTLAARGQMRVLGDITAPGGSISILQRLATTGSDQIGADYLYTSLFIGDQAHLNVDGVFVGNPDNLAYRDGAVLAGGSVSLGCRHPDRARRLADQRLGHHRHPRSADGLRTGLLPTQRSATTVGSDAGSISIAVDRAGVFDSTLVAEGGNATAAGGTLSLKGSSITVVSDARTVPVGAAPAQFLPLTFPSDIIAACPKASPCSRRRGWPTAASTLWSWRRRRQARIPMPASSPSAARLPLRWAAVSS